MTLYDAITAMDDAPWAALTKRVTARAIANAERLGQSVPAELTEVAEIPEDELASRRSAARLKQLTPEQLRRELTSIVSTVIAGEAGLASVAAVDPDLPFPELGLDSLNFVNMYRRVDQAIGVTTSPAAYWSYPTVALLVDSYLMPLMMTGHPRRAGEIIPDPPEPAALPDAPLQPTFTRRNP